MPFRVAVKPQIYADRSIQPGEKFNVEPADIHVLLVLERIQPEPGELGYVEPTYMTRDMESRRKRGNGH